MSTKEWVENHCIQTISTIYRKMNIINESQYIPPQQKANLQKIFISELQDTYTLCLPFFANDGSKSSNIDKVSK